MVDGSLKVYKDNIHMNDIIRTYLKEHIELFKQLLDANFIKELIEISVVISDSLKNGGKMVLFGNGGSAADAQHIAAEMVGKFRRERNAIPALALTTNMSIISAVANDYSYDKVFARQVEALVNEKDIVIGISTSGDSPSVIEGIRVARQKGARTIGLTGRGGGRLKDMVDICLKVPSDETPHIQEMHITLGHLLCSLIEEGISTRKIDTKRKPAKKRSKISFIVLDIDGVLTDGTVSITSGEEAKSLFYRDMDAINNGRREGLRFALVTAEETPIVEYIRERLQIEKITKAAKDKAEAIKRLSAELSVPLEQICYIGDSKRDAAAIGMVGLGLAPADADKEAQAAASYVLQNPGGKGAVAEGIELVLEHNALVQA
jgi:D-sedoheptulose 7-phosphate isomerase